jgi:hypothetical protein
MGKKKLTVAEVREIALKNYNRGGDLIVECWTDDDIREWINGGGTRMALKRMFSLFYNCCEEVI